MTTIEPHITVRNVDAVETVEYGQAGKVALIGAFPTATFKLDLFTTASAAKTALRGSVTEEQLATYPAYACLDYIFYNYGIKGPESVVIVNTNYDKGSLVTSSSNEDIAAACLLLAEENFDILCMAEPVSLAVSQTVETVTTYVLNPILSTLKSFVDSQFAKQRPFGIVAGFTYTNATITLIGEFKELFKKQGFFKAVSTPIKFNGAANPLTIEQSAAWHTAFTSGRAVNKSETAKTYPDIIGDDTKTIYPASTEVGAITFDVLRDNGFHTQTYKNRRLETIKCISNITPAMYDMKVERVKNYMIKRLTLEDYLGEDNDSITQGVIKGLFEFEKNQAIKSGLLLDMNYTLQVVDSETLKAQVELVIPEIIRVINLDVMVRVAAYEGE